MLDRREFLSALAALGATAATPGASQTKSRFASDPFSLGVASGYPRPDGAVIWTRLAPDPSRGDGGLDPTAIPVHWEVARDDRFASIAASGTAQAVAEWAHSVHVELNGLEPERWYWYRFFSGDAASQTGRLRTAPRLDALPSRLRFAFASCQHWEQGYFSAYRPMVADDLDLVVFLGDYIYESSRARDHVRRHSNPEPYTLDAYRMRYAQYKGDADLQAAHRAFPWIVTWDDHEVDNDYANDRAEDGMPPEQFLLRRAAAYKAYYEHLPLPASMRPSGPDMRIYTTVPWGRLANFYLLDERQYRSHQVCPTPTGRSSVVDPDKCIEISDPQRTMLGAAQEAWLDREFSNSRAAWNVVAQQLLMAQMDRKPGNGRRFWTDGWDGYPVARRRLLESIATRKLANPVVIGGDIHMHWVSDLKVDFDDPRSPVIASEFVCTSISSQAAFAQNDAEEVLRENPHLKYGRGDQRGYVRAEIGGGRFSAELIGMETVKVPVSESSVLARFVVEDGKPGPQRA